MAIERQRRRLLLLLLSREVLEEGEPHSRSSTRSDNAPTMMSVVAVMVYGIGIGIGSEKVSVDVFGARDKSAQVVCEIVQWARIVRSEERDDVCEARRCAVPFFFGRVFAGAVEDRAEAAR